jgi:hypothetical protein
MSFLTRRALKKLNRQVNEEDQGFDAADFKQFLHLVAVCGESGSGLEWQERQYWARSSVG